MPSPPSAIGRRRVLTGAGMLALLAVVTPACGSAPTPPAIGELEAQRQLALRDSALAAAAAAALTDPDAKALNAALDQVSQERAEHARSLAAEITRTTGKPIPDDSQATTAPDGSGPTVSQVTSALREAAEGAGALAVASSGYRAGLLASIAAACTASYAVALVTQA
ncbi:hypothetical protein [Mycolicibacter hiberniae]|uniref:Uncharacterized protein n=1 Tax=Mycolicibacter hiberniae TaxID=29314 RepID=A0A7I7X1Q2_9MYCO|nr:hypothetical protein [Mycolicibacter hiberniae]MCV7087855.1 hypothetical protein [Mycolicibacter hiberniae]ORV66330.1 hypothetical protein AWC09_02325 [Mycolicibacter hiberniae]BBZ23594.1 hypothetical protein MHIB_20120 [Mycolicibacter hiberniae]